MLFKQPRGLYLLFFTELWERFGYMSLQTIFVLYLSHVFHYSDEHAYLLLAAVGAFQWITPVPGGYMADKYIGFQRAIIIGGILLGLGYLLTAMPHITWFLVGLCFLILGNGLFKPNVSSIVGTLYQQGDPRRDSGFTLFYMGINVGSLLPPLFIGKLVMSYGWNSGFLLAAVGMALSLSIFLLGRKTLQKHGAIPKNSLLKHQSKKTSFNIFFPVGLVILGFLFYGGLLIPKQSAIILLIASILIVLFILRITLKLSTIDRNNMLVCLILTVISIGFWAIYMQCFSSLMLFADRNMSVSFLGLHIDAEFTKVFNPLFIIILSPFTMFLWPKLNEKKLNPSYPMKFALGTLFIALGLLALALAIKLFSSNGLTNPWWLVFSYFLQTLGELTLSPIGLAMITALTPSKYVGMMMGVWFLALAAAFALGGGLATLADVPSHATILQSQAIYMHAFFDYGWIGIGLTAVALLAIPKLKSMITLHHD